MSSLLGNPIILSIIVENLESAVDLATLCVVDRNIRATALAIIPGHPSIEKLSFKDRGRLKSKNLTTTPFSVLHFRALRLLNLSRTGITVSIVRSLVLHSKTLRFLQIVDCRKVEVSGLISLLRSIVKSRFGKRETPKETFAPLVCLDCWGISGLLLDYKYQNRQEWLFESFCKDNKNLQTLMEEAEILGIDLNMAFCAGEDHNIVHDIRYLPVARQSWGLRQCELMVKSREDQSLVLCDTCMLREHNRWNNVRHICRQETDIEVSILDHSEPIRSTAHE